MNRLPLRTRFLLLGIGSLGLLFLALTGLSLWQSERSVKLAQNVAETLAREDLDHIANGAYGLCETQHKELIGRLDRMLGRLRIRLNEQGGVSSAAAETHGWEAVNQETKQAQKVELPKMLIGNEWLGANTDPKTPSPFIDDAQRYVGGVITIFQRMNEAGDMLRVSTTVVTKDGKRGVSTFIPAKTATGADTPVVATILAGKTFRGRVKVVDEWCTSVYEPIRDSSGKIVGMLFAGLSDGESIRALKETLVQVRVGKTGYIYMLHAKPPLQGVYALSSGSKRDGEVIWEAKDSTGRLFIQDICKKALGRWRWGRSGTRGRTRASRSRGGSLPVSAISRPGTWL